MKLGNFDFLRKADSMQLCRDSTLHGLIHTSQTSTWLGFVFWFCVTFATLALGTWYSFALVQGFLADPILQSITILDSFEEGLKFPPITICFNHRTTNLKLTQANVSTEEFEYLAFSMLSINSVMPVNKDRLEQLYQKFSPGNESTIDFNDKNLISKLFRRLTPKCSELLLLCQTSGFTNVSCCNEANFETIVNFNGPCLELSFLSSYTQKLAGVAGGVLVALNLPDDENYPNATFFSYLLDGVQVFVSSYHAVLEVNPLYIRRGSQAMVQLSLMESFSIRDTQCYQSKNASLDDLNSVNNRFYYECVVECKRDEKYHYCSCIGVSSFDGISAGNYCTPAEARLCFLKMTRSTIEQIDLICFRRCKDNCHQQTYSLSVSSAPIVRQKLSLTYANELGMADRNLDNFIAMYLYFPDIRYTVIKETYTQTWQTLLSNVGGIYGLWSGASIVSLIHLIYFAIAKMIEKYKSQ